MDRKSQQIEAERNYDFFQRKLSEFLDQQEGRYALLRQCNIIGFFDAPGEADAAGYQKFPDGIFSIQQVICEPVHLGLYSNAAD
jgi:hypothetical protein